MAHFMAAYKQQGKRANDRHTLQNHALSGHVVLLVHSTMSFTGFIHRCSPSAMIQSPLLESLNTVKFKKNNELAQYVLTIYWIYKGFYYILFILLFPFPYLIGIVSESFSQFLQNIQQVLLYTFCFVNTESSNFFS